MKVLTLFLCLVSPVLFAGVTFDKPIPLTAEVKELLAEKSRHEYTILTFGYTQCSDVCPMTMHNAKRLVLSLRKHGMDVGVVFVSIDPDRDSAEMLERYTATREGGVDFLLLPEADLERLKSSFSVEAYALNKFKGNQSYVIDHSSTSFLLKDQSEMISIFDISASDVDVAQFMHWVSLDAASLVADTLQDGDV